MKMILHPILNKCFFITCIWLLGIQTSISQNVFPKIKNYTKADYSGYLQNWSIDQTEEGLIAIGNQAGLMLFNGATWSLHQMPNQTTIRSVHCVNNRIYVGSYEEFGYFHQTPNGIFVYESISDTLQKPSFQNDEFWTILDIDNLIYFRSFSDIYEYNITTNQVQKLNTSFVPSGIEKIREQLYVFSVNGPAYRLQNNTFQPIETPVSLQTQSLSITTVPRQDSLLICSQSFDCYQFNGKTFTPFQVPKTDFTEQNQLNVITTFPNGDLFFGSIQKGGYYYSPITNEGYKLNYNGGLANNTVLDALIDKENNLWLALDDGISYIENQSPNRYYFDDTGTLGAVYTAIQHENKLYLGSNHGLFYFEDNELKKVKGINNQVWYLQSYNGILFCGHNEGTSIIRENDQSTLISDISGGWQLKPLPDLENTYLQSSYTGLEKIDNSFRTKKLPGFLAPVKYFEWVDDHTILAADAYKGLYKIKLSNDYNSVKEATEIGDQSFSNSYNVRLVKVNESIFAYTNRWYRYDYVTGELVRDSTISKIFNNPLYVASTKMENSIWAIHGNGVSLYNTQSKALQNFPINLLQNLRVTNNEEIIQTNPNQYLLTLNNGFVSFKPSAQDSTQLKQPIIYNVASEKSANENILQKKINYTSAPFTISFATPEYQDNIQYEYRFGEDGDWITTTQNNLMFENLPSGNNRFQVRTVYPDNNRSSITTYSFYVTRHLLQQWWAYMIYIILGCAIYFLYRNFQKARMRKKQVDLKKKLHQEHLHRVKEEKLEYEKQIAEVKNEQLEHTIEVKKKELANSALSLVKKNELLSEIKTSLLKAKKEGSQEEIKKTIRNIDQSLSQKENWKLFETQFNEVHKEFLDKLKTQFPNLTKKDLKLCAYLKMNLTSKEIAPLMNITTRGVETHRYRLRKKLDIESNENFQKYLEKM